MPKIIRGTGDAKGVVVLKSDQQSLRSMRCPQCHGAANAVALPNGKQVCRCSACGAQFSASPF